MQLIHTKNQDRTNLGTTNEQKIQKELTNYKINFTHNVTNKKGELDICINDSRFGKNPIILEVTTDKIGANAKCIGKQWAVQHSDYIVTTQDNKQSMIYKIDKNEITDTFKLGQSYNFTNWIESYL